MTTLPPAHAEDALDHLAQQFAHQLPLPRFLFMLEHLLQCLGDHGALRQKNLLQLAELAPPVRQTVAPE